MMCDTNVVAAAERPSGWSDISDISLLARRLLDGSGSGLSVLPSRLLRGLAAGSLLFLGSCISGTAGKLDASDLTQGGEIEVCDGQTLAQLEHANTVSDGCKAELSQYLPASSSDFGGRVVVLGRETRDDGSLRVFLAGADGNGNALSATAFGAAHLSIGGDAGTFVESAVQPKATPFNKLGEAPLSIELVNDYSASMSLADLHVVQRIQQELFTALPPIYEGEVTLFSTEVRVKQSFTSNRDLLLEAVECDESFDRELTALYDGMGNGLDSLTSRTRPARVLMVSTDGRENASVAYKKQDIVQTLADDGVFVIMLGALFADVNELKSLAGPRGVYFYTPLYANMNDEVSDLIQALASGAALDIPADIAQKRPLRIEIAGESVEID
jgi:hypothetical protein